MAPYETARCLQLTLVSLLDLKTRAGLYRRVGEDSRQIGRAWPASIKAKCLVHSGRRVGLLTAYFVIAVCTVVPDRLFVFREIIIREVFQ